MNAHSVNAGVIIAELVRAKGGKLIGIIATNLSLDELSEPRKAVVQAQQVQGRRLMINIIDENGELIATHDPMRNLQTILDELPGADQALKGHETSLLGLGSMARTGFTAPFPSRMPVGPSSYRGLQAVPPRQIASRTE
jgi:hypothetical protein